MNQIYGYGVSKTIWKKKTHVHVQLVFELAPFFRSLKKYDSKLQIKYAGYNITQVEKK